MASSYQGQSRINFKRLVTDCWGLLKGSSYMVFPGTKKSHPSQVVLVQPTNMTPGWDGPFWEEVVIPTIRDLINLNPPFGWGSLQAKSLTEAYLRRALLVSSWVDRVDW